MVDRALCRCDLNFRRLALFQIVGIRWSSFCACGFCLSSCVLCLATDERYVILYVVCVDRGSWIMDHGSWTTRYQRAHNFPRSYTSRIIVLAQSLIIIRWSALLVVSVLSSWCPDWFIATVHFCRQRACKSWPTPYASTYTFVAPT